MDDFTKAYIECALWSSNDESDPSGGTPIDDNYDEGDLDPPDEGEDGRRLQTVPKGKF